MAACCYCGVDLRNQLDKDFCSRLTDGTPYFSSDSLSLYLLLTFTWTNSSKSNSLSPFYSLGQIYSKSNFPFSSFFFDNLFIFQFLFPVCSSWTKNSKSNSKFHKNIPRQFCFLQFHFNSTKKFQVQLSFWFKKNPIFTYPFHTLSTGV